MQDDGCVVLLANAPACLRTLDVGKCGLTIDILTAAFASASLTHLCLFGNLLGGKNKTTISESVKETETKASAQVATDAKIDAFDRAIKRGMSEYTKPIAEEKQPAASSEEGAMVAVRVFPMSSDLTMPPLSIIDEDIAASVSIASPTPLESMLMNPKTAAVARLSTLVDLDIGGNGFDEGIYYIF